MDETGNKALNFKQAQEILRGYIDEHMIDGVTCPCCDKFVKAYDRIITSSMAFGLIMFHRHATDQGQDDWTHAERLFDQLDGVPSSIRGDFPKLRYWGLLEAMIDERPDGSKRNGHYRITPTGHDFAMGKMKVTKHALVYNDTPIHFFGEMISVHDSLQNRFSYNSLMSRRLV